MGVYSTTTANAYADKIKVVYEHLDHIRKVADRLTPVEDLSIFQAKIEELHSYLDLLVEASNIIVTATPTGEAILTGTVPSIRTLLGIDDLLGDWVTWDELNALLDALRAELLVLVNQHGDNIETINLSLDTLDQYRLIQLSQINGLQINYANTAAGLETAQSNLEIALSRLTVTEQFATLVDLRVDTISQNLISTTTGLQAANDIIAGHTASITTAHDYISLHTTSIDQLSSTLTDLDTEITVNATALNLLETTVTGMGDDIVAQSQQTTALRSVIGGSGNLLSNADFAVGANGWDIVVAEEDWAATVLTTNTFNMPPEVNCLEALGTPTPLGQIVIESPPLLVEGGKHYMVSGYPCIDNGTIQLSYKTFNAAGLVVDQGACPPTFNATTSTNIADYTRTWVKFLASLSAVKMRLYLTATADGDFITQAALFRPMVEQSWADQAGPSAWTPNVSGVPEALAEAVQTLTTEVSDINGQLTAQAGQITTLQSQVSTLPTVYLQADMPLGSAYNVGDIWFETDNGNKQYIWNGTLWGDTASISGTVNYAQSTEPTGGSYNVGDLWIDTSDNNRLYRWNGTAWVDVSDTRITSTATALSSLTTRVTNAEGVNTSQAGALTALGSRITSAEGVNTSQATAISGLDTRVTAAEGTISSQATSITSLTSRIGAAEGDNATQATAISGLETRVTAAEGVNTSQATSITNLQVGVSNIGGDNLLKNAGFEVNSTGTGMADSWLLSSSATGITYSNPASDLAGSTVSQRIAGTVVAGTYTGAVQLVDGIVEGEVYSAAGMIKASTAGGAGTPTSQVIVQWRDASNVVIPPTSYSAVVSNAGGTWKQPKMENLVAPAGAVTAVVYLRATTPAAGTIQVWLDNVSFQKGAVATNFAPGVADTAGAVQSLTARVTSAEGTITSTSSALTALTATVGTKANASALTALEARVTSAEGVNTSQASAITTLNADLGDASASITRIDQVVASAAVGNALRNPSFEYGLDGWTPANAQASLRTDAVNARTGTRMLNIVGHATAGLRGSAINNDFIPVKAGQTVKLGFYGGVYGAAIAPVGAYMRLDVYWYDANQVQLATGGYVASNCTMAAPTARWTQANGSIVAPAAAVYMKIRPITSATSGTWVMDDITVEPLTDLAANTYATSGVTLDVNGYVTGYRQMNNGTTGIFAIVADKFQIIAPGSSARTEYSSNNWRVYDASNVLRVRMGVW